MAVVARKRLKSREYDVVLSGSLDGVNLSFSSPTNFDPVTLLLFKNGQRQTLSGDYTVSESGGLGTGFDTITFIAAPPKSVDILRVDYVPA